MEDPTSIELRRLQKRLNRFLQEFTGTPLVALAAQDVWTPAINAYWAGDRILICVDLAGVDKTAIDLNVESQRLVLRGRRELPEPRGGGRTVERVLALEINHGPFGRVVTLPDAVDPARTTAELRNGLLWVVLPLAGKGNAPERS
ncbi:MAG TPA: Hsp20/alpha crystallin family protein [Verrucomicrobiae bacterium]|nr:Hsp20/alpha crystallin family protein [Verrucomicrobiae bacterium]